MFGPGIFSVFRSRWRALWWSAGILLTAYCSIPAQDESQNTSADPKAKADAEAQAKAVEVLFKAEKQMR